MTVLHILFYILAAVILGTTAMAVTRKNLVHAIVYLIQSFFATALLFYLLGAPLLAALEVIIYAGAIMVLFLFIVMTLSAGSFEAKYRLKQWALPVVLGIISLGAGLVLLLPSPAARVGLAPASVPPVAFGRYLFEHYWFAVEIVSFLLFVALVGAYFLGRYKTANLVQPEVKQ